MYVIKTGQMKMKHWRCLFSSSFALFSMSCFSLWEMFFIHISADVAVQDFDCSNVEMSGEHWACVNISGMVGCDASWVDVCIIVCILAFTCLQVCKKECLNCMPTFLYVYGDFSGTPFNDCVDKPDVSTYELENECTELVYRYCMEVGYHFNMTFDLGNLVGSATFGPHLICEWMCTVFVYGTKRFTTYVSVC